MRRRGGSYQQYLQSPGWKGRRLALVVERGSRCERCSKKKPYWELDVHHEAYAKDLRAVPLEDLMVVCRECHDILESVKSEAIYTKAMNDGRSVFVFGSNLAGIHGAGAALEARRNWGAALRVGEGRTGQSYAIPTKDARLRVLPLEAVQTAVEAFIAYAAQRPQERFLVTRIGCGLAGYSDSAIAPMFAAAPQNCVLPQSWEHILRELSSSVPSPQ